MKLMSKLRDMKKRFLPLSMLLITIVLAQASLVANAAGNQGKYTPRTVSKATFSSFMKSIRANQETGLIDPASLLAGQKAAQKSSKDGGMDWVFAGPDNYGGMTRAMLYDTDGSILIGTMGGDIFKSTNGGITFGRVTDINLPISCMAKTANGDIFVGTGDGRDAETLNGMSEIGYATSFVGNGIYKLASGSTTLEQLASTTPTANNGWSFVNDLAVANNKIYAATAGGLMVSADNGESWNNVQAGYFRSIKTNGNGDILAADDANVYLSKNGGAFTNVTDAIEANDYPKIIAMSQSDANYMYIAYLEDGTSTGNIYFTADGGNTWGMALASTSLYEIFESTATHDGYMTVHPTNPRRVFAGSSSLWSLEDKTGQGVNSYKPTMISNPLGTSVTATYVHEGIQNMLFNPSNPNVFFIGTNGGVYKGTYTGSNLYLPYSFTGCNRYYITDDVHTSVTRMTNVGIGGTAAFLAGSLDHGTIMIADDDMLNNATTGYGVFPHVTNNLYVSALYTLDYAGGPCAISTIDPDIYFVSATGSLSTPIYRSQTAGEDYDQNFEGESGPIVTNENAFRTPFVFYETYNDEHTSISIHDLLDTIHVPVQTIIVHEGETYEISDTLWVQDGAFYSPSGMYFYSYWELDDTFWQVDDTLLYISNVLHDVPITYDTDFDTLNLVIKREAKAGDTYYYYSAQSGYPIDYVLPEPPHDANHVDPDGGYMWIAGDTIPGLHDPLKTTYVCAVESGIYMTRDALIFDKTTDWFLITSDFEGLPTALTISSDGSTVLMGTTDGTLYKFTHIDDVFASEQASLEDTLNPCVEMFDLSIDEFAGRAITSIAINPNDINEILVTLGNYDNSEYVYVSTNGGTSFTAANFSLFPVYSSIIEKENGTYVIGTEHGIYTSDNGSTWEKSGNLNCPVLDIKQAIMENHPTKVDVLYDEMGAATYVYYPGIENEGMIYAATYGVGIVKCDSYAIVTDPNNGDDDPTATTTEVEQLNIYPNPVRDFAQFDINVESNTTVSYVIYDLSGRTIEAVNLGNFNEGTHTLNVDTKDMPKGSYIIRVYVGEKTESAKFLVY